MPVSISSIVCAPAAPLSVLSPCRRCASLGGAMWMESAPCRSCSYPAFLEKGSLYLSIWKSYLWMKLCHCVVAPPLSSLSVIQSTLCPAAPILLSSNSSESLFGSMSESSMSPTSRCPESPPSGRELSIALDLHLLHGEHLAVAYRSRSVSNGLQGGQ